MARKSKEKVEVAKHTAHIEFFSNSIEASVDGLEGMTRSTLDRGVRELYRAYHIAKRNMIIKDRPVMEQADEQEERVNG